ncbi:gliding motility protein GldL [Aurantibacter sp.]|uniref:gliding motility protein GldL n=1 Tax=Aurantibacter sp. TaxID=2807103 RepID=UPI0035C78B66
MKLKEFITPLIVLLIGIGLTILGATFKILHLQFAPQLLLVGTFIEFFAILLTIIKLIKIARNKN